jgi:predicted transposase/invertase (TIGR01784 family)
MNKRMAYGLLTSISQDEDERARFRARRKFQMDLEHNRIVSFEEGKSVGITEGIIEGERKGIIKVARNLLSKGVSLDIIAQSTGLSSDEIQALSN